MHPFSPVLKGLKLTPKVQHLANICTQEDAQQTHKFSYTCLRIWILVDGPGEFRFIHLLADEMVDNAAYEKRQEQM